MRRILAGTVAVATLVMPGTGQAGGGSWLDTERHAYAVGERAVASTTFFSGAYEGTVGDGPFYAYLVPGFRSLKTPGPIPEYAVPIGPLTIARASRNWVARVEFTVPDVPTGLYSIDYCNDPCTIDGIEDLIGGSFYLGQTLQEAQLARQVDRLGWNVDRLKNQREKWADRAAELEEQLDEATAAPPIASAAGREAIPAPTDAPRPILPGWSLVVVSLAVVGAALLLRRWRTPTIPDTVPPELAEAVAQVPSRQPMTSVGSPGIVRASPGMSPSGSSPLTKS